MKKINILYWVFTGLFAAFMLFTAIPNIISNEQSIDLIHTTLGYPLYFIPFIGVAKALGALALVIPGLPRWIKEWSYSGLMFDLIAATYSIIAAIGSGIGNWAPMLPAIVIGGLSYFYFHKRSAATA